MFFLVLPVPATYRRPFYTFPLFVAVLTGLILCLGQRVVRARGTARVPAAALLVLGTAALLAGGSVVSNVVTDPGNPRPAWREENVHALPLAIEAATASVAIRVAQVLAGWRARRKTTAHTESVTTTVAEVVPRDTGKHPVRNSTVSRKSGVESRY